MWSTQVEPAQIIYRAESLCLTLNNNDIPVITITAPNTSSNPIEVHNINDIINNKFVKYLLTYSIL